MAQMDDIGTLSAFLKNQLTYRRLGSAQLQHVHPAEIESLETIKDRIEAYIERCKPLSIEDKIDAIRGALTAKSKFNKILHQESLAYHGLKQKMQRAFYCHTHHLTLGHIDHCIKKSFSNLPNELREELTFTLPTEKAPTPWLRHSEEISSLLDALSYGLKSEIMPDNLHYNPFKYDLEEAFTEAIEDKRDLPLSSKLHEHFFKILEENYKPVEEFFNDITMADVMKQFRAYRGRAIGPKQYDYIAHDQSGVEHAVNAYRENKSLKFLEGSRGEIHPYRILRYRVPGPSPAEGGKSYEKLTEVANHMMTDPRLLKALKTWELLNP